MARKPKKDQKGAVVWTDGERKFATAVLRHGNLARAYREAYPNCSIESSRSAASQCYARPHVRAYIEAENKSMMDRLSISAERVKERLAMIAFGNLGLFMKADANGNMNLTIDEASEIELACVQECIVETYMDGKGENARPVKSVKIKLISPVAAAELLGKTMKMFTDKIEFSGHIEMPIAEFDENA